jgi:hypothetical protein
VLIWRPYHYVSLHRRIPRSRARSLPKNLSEAFADWAKDLNPTGDLDNEGPGGKGTVEQARGADMKVAPQAGENEAQGLITRMDSQTGLLGVAVQGRGPGGPAPMTQVLEGEGESDDEADETAPEPASAPDPEGGQEGATTAGVAGTSPLPLAPAPAAEADSGRVDAPSGGCEAGGGEEGLTPEDRGGEEMDTEPQVQTGRVEVAAPAMTQGGPLPVEHATEDRLSSGAGGSEAMPRPAGDPGQFGEGTILESPTGANRLSDADGGPRGRSSLEQAPEVSEGTGSGEGETVLQPAEEADSGGEGRGRLRRNAVRSVAWARQPTVELRGNQGLWSQP